VDTDAVSSEEPSITHAQDQAADRVVRRGREGSPRYDETQNGWMQSGYGAGGGPVYNPQPSFPFLNRNGQKFGKRAFQHFPRRHQGVRGIPGKNPRFQLVCRRGNPLDAKVTAARLQAVRPLADRFPIRGASRIRLGQYRPFLGQFGAVLFHQRPDQGGVATTGG